jgi:hypothetical protein
MVRLQLKSVYSEKNFNIEISCTEMNTFLFQMSQSLNLTESLQNRIDLHKQLLKTGSYLVVTILGW